MTGSPGPLSLSEAIARLGAWLDDRLHGGAQSEVERLTAAELARTARDLGLSDADLRCLSRMDKDRTQPLVQRLALVELTMDDLVATGLTTTRDLQRTCALCDRHAACEHDIAERPESREWISYCPNSEPFRRALEDADRRSQPRG